MFRTMMMASPILLLATVASAQYAITDLLSKDEGGSSSPSTQQGAPLTDSSATPRTQFGISPTTAQTAMSPPTPQSHVATGFSGSQATGPQAGRENPFQGSPPGMIAGNQVQTAPGMNAGNQMQTAPGMNAGNQMQTFGASNAGNPMQTLLAGVAGSMGAHPMASPGSKPLNGVLSQDSMAVVSGLVEAFMHKVQLQPGERACLERNMGQLTGDVMGTVGDVVTAVKALIQGKGTIAKNEAGGVVSAGIDSAMKITSLVALSTQFVKSCVHGDALVLLKETAHHLVNASYLEHRFLVNGVDIAHSLSDSVVAFESKDFHRFGADIGFSLRKVLLSKATNGTTLPEGVPEQDIIEKASAGLMRGFFVSGSSVSITDTAHPDVDIVINLHQCIAGNSAFFKELWLAAWNLFAQLSVNAEHHKFGLQAFNGKNGGQPKWSGELMIAMMQFPMALAKCGVAQDMQKMFMEAIKTLNDIRVKIQVPDNRFRAVSSQQKTEETTERMAKAVADFTKWDFEGFGYEIGTMLRELVMLAFPQQYSIDASGRLQRYSQMEALDSGKAASISNISTIIGGAVVSLLLAKFAVIAVRAHRSSPNVPADVPAGNRMVTGSDVEGANSGAE